MIKPGFTITAKGWEVLANVLAGEKILKIHGVAFGDGALPEGENPAVRVDLVHAIADGTTSVAEVTTQTDELGVVKQSTISFIAEYRSDFERSGVSAPITDRWPMSVENDFYIREFGVWAEDPTTGQSVMIYYATLGEMPHPVTSYQNNAIDIRRYPVSIVISSDMNVELTYPPLAFVTSEEMERYVAWFHENVCEVDVDAKIRAHNEALDAHLNIRSHVISNDDRITALERLLAGTAAAQFREDFSDDENISFVAGVYNAQKRRIEL